MRPATLRLPSACRIAMLPSGDTLPTKLCFLALRRCGAWRIWIAPFSTSNQTSRGRPLRQFGELMLEGIWRPWYQPSSRVGPAEGAVPPVPAQPASEAQQTSRATMVPRRRTAWCMGVLPRWKRRRPWSIERRSTRYTGHSAAVQPPNAPFGEGAAFKRAADWGGGEVTEWRLAPAAVEGPHEASPTIVCSWHRSDSARGRDGRFRARQPETSACFCGWAP